MKKKSSWLAAASFLGSLLVIAFSIPAYAVDLDIKVVPDRPSYAPGDTAVLVVNVTIPDKHHLYSNPLGPGIGKPLMIGLVNTPQLKPLTLHKTKPKKYQPSIGDWVWAYEKEAHFFLKVLLPNTTSDSARGTLAFDGLVCHTACTPISKEIPFAIAMKPGSAIKAFESVPVMKAIYSTADTMGLPHPAPSLSSDMELLDLDLTVKTDTFISTVAQTYSWTYTPVESRKDFNIFLAIFFGFIAGVILNFMPCVLPVLGIKILSFSQGQSGSKKQAILHSLVFSAGMLLLFMVLASLASWAGYSWGQQFQNPWVLTGIICLIFFFSLGMFDVYTMLVPASVGNLESKSSKHSLWGDFFRGMFATILATPCSGPFLGATLAWTLTQKPIIIYLVFFSIGAGMAFPYVLLSVSSRIMKLVPKPGKWMQDFKHIMGFFLFGFAVYLMIGLPRDMVISVVGMCVALAFAAMVYARIAPWGAPISKKILGGGLAVLVVASGIYINYGVIYAQTSDKAVAALEKNSTGKWESFTPDRLTSALESGRSVMIDFTATWCMNCQYNKIAVLHASDVNKIIDNKGIVTLKADLTNDNPAAQSLLNHLGSRSVPFLAIFNAGNPQSPVIMRDVLSKRSVTKELSRLP